MADSSLQLHGWSSSSVCSVQMADSHCCSVSWRTGAIVARHDCGANAGHTDPVHTSSGAPSTNTHLSQCQPSHTMSMWFSLTVYRKGMAELRWGGKAKHVKVWCLVHFGKYSDHSQLGYNSKGSHWAPFMSGKDRNLKVSGYRLTKTGKQTAEEMIVNNKL